MGCDNMHSDLLEINAFLSGPARPTPSPTSSTVAASTAPTTDSALLEAFTVFTVLAERPLWALRLVTVLPEEWCMPEAILEVIPLRDSEGSQRGVRGESEEC